jgi:nitronate monooxygenase
VFNKKYWKKKKMNFQNKVTDLLKIKYPIMQGGMQNLAYPHLAAAVSNAGGLGTINISIWPDQRDFRQAIQQTKALTDNPICVNISMLPTIPISDHIPEYIQICAEEGVEVIETSGKNPAPLVQLIHANGLIHIHKVPSIKHAQKAQSIGVDIVSIIGAEAAGHPGPDLVSTLVLGAKAAQTLTIPYLLGGGVADGRGFAAMLALGAQGVVMGSRFVASTECQISANHKQWILQAAEKDTVLCLASINNIARVANNQAAQECLEMEKDPNITLQDLMPIISGAVGKAAYQSGDISKGLFSIGQNIGIINQIKPVSQIIEEMVSEASLIFENLTRV